ncbi:hypothetical protein G6F32_015421 [Rhizopus arrhizus]|nr:hypothetical protein G6F32_015421 [Rhizopus arrhizus]
MASAICAHAPHWPSSAAVHLPARTGAGRARPGQLAARAGRAWHSVALEERHRTGAAQADRTRTGADPAEALRLLLPHRAGHCALRAQPGHPLPGPWLGGQLGGVLRAGRDRNRSGTQQSVVRALHLRRTRRTTGYRLRLRAR